MQRFQLRHLAFGDTAKSLLPERKTLEIPYEPENEIENGSRSVRSKWGWKKGASSLSASLDQGKAREVSLTLSPAGFQIHPNHQSQKD